jgi:hypothetical protein
MKSKALRATVLGLALIGAAVTGANAQRILRDVLKVGGAVVLADKFGDEINSGINGITRAGKLQGSADIDTKVVPVLSVGSGAFVGIVQVAGPPEQVQRVKAVAQLEGGLKVAGGMRAKVLVPIDSRNPTNLSRVNGVGLSAIIDVRLGR